LRESSRITVSSGLPLSSRISVPRSAFRMSFAVNWSGDPPGVSSVLPVWLFVRPAVRYLRLSPGSDSVGRTVIVGLNLLRSSSCMLVARILYRDDFVNRMLPAVICMLGHQLLDGGRVVNDMKEVVYNVKSVYTRAIW
jgi:hypothetical protein